MNQAEIEFGVEQEQGQMLQLLMRHFQRMRRQETLLRAATALLLATFFATLLWLQFHQQMTADSGANAGSASLQRGSKPKGLRSRQSVNLKSNDQFGSCTENQPVGWNMMNDFESKNFKLENKTHLQISKEGLYLINVMITYRIAYDQCKFTTQPNTDQKLILEVNVTQSHSSYKLSRLIVSSKESMLCREYWLQTITLSRVVMLQAGTSLIVTINPESCKFMAPGKNNHFDVTNL